MPRPTTKTDLLEAAEANYLKLEQEIEKMTKTEMETPYDFSGDSKKKEAHWKRDKNLRDVLAHLNEWHNLMLNWIDNNQKGMQIPFLMEGYNWKTYGDMNLVFWKNCQKESLEKVHKKFQDSHKKIVAEINKFSNEELFSKDAFSWSNGNSLGAYFVSVSSSHYEWARKKIIAHRKIVNV